MVICARDARSFSLEVGDSWGHSVIVTAHRFCYTREFVRVVCRVLWADEMKVTLLWAVLCPPKIHLS